MKLFSHAEHQDEILSCFGPFLVYKSPFGVWFHFLKAFTSSFLLVVVGIRAVLVGEVERA